MPAGEVQPLRCGSGYPVLLSWTFVWTRGLPEPPYSRRSAPVTGVSWHKSCQVWSKIPVEVSRPNAVTFTSMCQMILTKTKHISVISSNPWPCTSVWAEHTSKSSSWQICTTTAVYTGGLWVMAYSAWPQNVDRKVPVAVMKSPSGGFTSLVSLSNPATEWSNTVSTVETPPAPKQTHRSDGHAFCPIARLFCSEEWRTDCDGRSQELLEMSLSLLKIKSAVQHSHNWST